MKRYSDWETRLLAFLLSRRHTPFAWGGHDCSLFACDAVLAMTGVDIAADFRGTYSTALQAARVIKKFAGSDIIALAEKRAQEAKLSEIKPLTARRGDIALVRKVDGTALGIIGLNPRYAYCVADPGFQRFPMSNWIRAWRVG